MEPLTVSDRNKMSAMLGLILAVVNIVLTTVTYSQVGNMVMVSVLGIVDFLAILALMILLGMRVRKANGGYIVFKEIFAALFIMSLIASVLSYFYSFVYINYINPDYVVQMKAGMMSMFEKLKVPDETLDKTMAEMDKKTEQVKGFNLLSLAGSVLTYAVFALIAAAIVKKNKPMFGADGFDVVNKNN
jgi:hypothetical protein